VRRVDWTNPQIQGLKRAQTTSPSFEDLDNGYVAPSGGTTVPTVPTVGALGAFKSVAIYWDVQSNLTNFANYEVQVSTDDSNWYSLDFDGAGLETAGNTTPWSATVLVHAPLPLNGTDDAPTASTWYYRVRRVTKAATDNTSAWSTSVSADALPTQPGDLAANSIYANNIRAGEITADKLDADVLNAQIANINSSLQISDTVGFVAGQLGTPSQGDRRAFLDDNEIAIEDYYHGEWRPVAKMGSVDQQGDSNIYARNIVRAEAGYETAYPALLDTLKPWDATYELWDVCAYDGTITALMWYSSLTRNVVVTSTDGGDTWGTPVFVGDSSFNVKGQSIWMADVGGTVTTAICTNIGAIYYSEAADLNQLSWAKCTATIQGTASIWMTHIKYDGTYWWISGVNDVEVQRKTDITDNGTAWDRRTPDTNGAVYDLAIAGDGRMMVADSYGEHFSDDYGSTWTEMTVGFDSTPGTQQTSMVAYDTEFDRWWLGSTGDVAGSKYQSTQLAFSDDDGSSWTVLENWDGEGSYSDGTTLVANRGRLLFIGDTYSYCSPNNGRDVIQMGVGGDSGLYFDQGVYDTKTDRFIYKSSAMEVSIVAFTGTAPLNYIGVDSTGEFVQLGVMRIYPATVASAGPAGPAGPQGEPGNVQTLNWLPDAASDPGSPNVNDAYYNTTAEESRIYTGAVDGWQTIAQDGTDGTLVVVNGGTPATQTFYIDDDAPTSGDGVNGDIWLEY
jgi:hypothetical protein